LGRCAEPPGEFHEPEGHVLIIGIVFF
jgi:hypothetical protein